MKPATPSIQKLLLGSACLSACCTVFSGCNIPAMEAKETRNVSVAVSDSSQVEINTKNGAITLICQADLSEAKVEAIISCRAHTQELADQRLAETELVVENSAGNTLKIYPKFADPQTNGDSASIVLHIPSVESVDLKTANGKIEVDGTLSSITGKVKVLTSNGHVTILSAQSVQAESSNGALKIEKVGGDVVARTSNGAISIGDVAGAVDVESSNGKIDVGLNAGQQGPIRARTSNGSISLKVAADFSGRVTANSSNAKIVVNDPTNRVTDSNIKKSTGELTIGSGSSVSELTTSNGTIKITIEPQL